VKPGVSGLPQHGLLKLLPCLCLALASCGHGNARDGGPRAEEFRLGSLAKTDVGKVIEVHHAEARAHLRELAEKLYKRNPRELRKSVHPTAQHSIRHLFDDRSDWRLPELGGRTGIDALRLAFSDDYRGDRVFAFMAGLVSMVMQSYSFKSEFYFYDSVHPQNLYNCARNIEIAAWKLRHDRDAKGEPYLYSISLPGEPENVSYERLFGKLISLQDTIAIIVAGKTDRIITRVVQRMATAMFLPLM
jgi:hypothetical protein